MLRENKYSIPSRKSFRLHAKERARKEQRTMTRPLPAFWELPLRKGDPPHSAWGLYGDDDQLGTLNRLSEEVVLRAAKEEIQRGER